MLFRTLKRMMERGQIEDLQEKLDIFLAADKITIQEYTELSELLLKA